MTPDYVEALKFGLIVVTVGALARLVMASTWGALHAIRVRCSSRLPLPRLVRQMILFTTSFIAVARPAHASQGNASTRAPSSQDDSGRSPYDPILVGSVVANGVFCAAHVRRALVKLRQRRFGNGATKQEEASAGHHGKDVESPDWHVIVRVLGPPSVETRDGQRVEFGKGKARELLVWMSEHRQTSTRSAARTALWEGVVQDATFSNVVSEVRRALNSAVPLADEEWVPRTFTDELPLSSGVITDAEILESLTRDFMCDREVHLEQLKTAIGQVRNLPFSGANYPWADGEGITTSHVIKVVKAAVLLAEYAIECDDTDLLFMATERGLRVLPGHEELVSLRMRGHARTGNRSAIKLEWESYSRAIEADSWAGAAPSRELEALACELSKS